MAVLTADIGTRLDANEELFFQEQLTLIEQELIEVKYHDLKARSHFVTDFSGGNAIETIKYYISDRYGTAAVGLGFPRVGVKRQPRFMNIQPITDSYGFTFQEIRSANHVGMDLDSSLALTAHRKIAELEDKIAYLGDAESGLMGAFTHPNFPVLLGSTPVRRGTAASQIVDEFNVILNAAHDMTNGIEKTNTCLLPPKMMSYLETTPYSDQAPQLMVMDIIRNGHKDVEFDECVWCNGNGPSGEDIIFTYNRDARNMKLRIPLDFETFPPRVGDKEETVVNCHERFGGLQVHFAVGIVYYAA